ncbi:putative 20S cyclosome subunit [Aulographum hederae CBS 113979]|uniref:Putative 20S cyclosome subunit n=1 Tax=Aulographum hederae CBS 113979 TaxID=1176131 RepID=A0A6G1H6T0_9PEZI|nr:putative 20S cyclosome subunit [Aulographum hederae CBS 113979]
MSPGHLQTTQTYAASQLRMLIYYNLDNNLHQNALFFAGRLHALEPQNPDAVHLLSLCHLRLGEARAAFDYSKEKAMKGGHLGCSYVFAQACLDLQRYSEGIAALEKSRKIWSSKNNFNKHSETSRRHLPDASVVYSTMGKLWRAQGDLKKAAECQAEALKLNPFMWDAFTGLCDTGVGPLLIQNVFKMTPQLASMYEAVPDENLLDMPTQNMPPYGGKASMMTPGNDPFNSAPVRTAGDPGLNHGGSNLLSRLNAPSSRTVEWETPGVGSEDMDEDIIMGEPSSNSSMTEPPQAPIRKSRVVTSSIQEQDIPRMRQITTRTKKTWSSEATDPSEPSRGLPLPTNHKRNISGHTAQSVASVNSDNSAPQRRSVRLFNQIRPSSSRSAAPVPSDSEARAKKDAKKPRIGIAQGRSTSTVGRVVSGNRKHEPIDRDYKEAPRHTGVLGNALSSHSRRPIQQNTKAGLQVEGLQWLLDLFKTIGIGYYELSRHQPHDALAAFDSIPIEQRDTPWVLAQRAKALYQQHNYVDAEEAFSRLRVMAPSRMQDMEIYSTVLWHLRKPTDLSYLAHVLIDDDRLAPEAWCALGNAFALEREHDRAVNCFARATQLNPRFAYAWTLQGLEHVENEEFNKAVHAYRSAITVDPRQFQGWYGLGQVFERSGKYLVAEKHYRKAAEINPTNPLLLVCVGSVLEKQKKNKSALEQYAAACNMDPRNRMTRQARFKKARVLQKLRQYDEALVELEILKEMTPKEPNVHFLLGKNYKLLGERQLALKHFTMAMDLDPKSSSYVKEHLDAVAEDEDYDFSDD